MLDITFRVDFEINYIKQRNYQEKRESNMGSVAVRGNLANGCHTADNTVFPKLEDDECDWDASGTPVRYVTC